jgi:pyrimidine deaminase RibD-like protein
MAAAIALAERGKGRTVGNPSVGCIIVKQGRVIGRGWTQPGGRPHAEAMALDEAGAAAALRAPKRTRAELRGKLGCRATSTRGRCLDRP